MASRRRCHPCFQEISGRLQDARPPTPDSGPIAILHGETTIDTHCNRPAVVMLSAMWTLAAVLSAAAFAVSASAGEPSRGAGPTAVHVASTQTVDRRPPSSMLREPRLSISKDKLD
jgi:hypothetical protein